MVIMANKIICHSVSRRQIGHNASNKWKDHLNRSSKGRLTCVSKGNRMCSSKEQCNAVATLVVAVEIYNAQMIIIKVETPATDEVEMDK